MKTLRLTIGRRERDYTFEVDCDNLDICNRSGVYLTGKRYEIVWNMLTEQQKKKIDDAAMECEFYKYAEGRPFVKEY